MQMYTAKTRNPNKNTKKPTVNILLNNFAKLFLLKNSAKCLQVIAIPQITNGRNMILGLVDIIIKYTSIPVHAKEDSSLSI